MCKVTYVDEQKRIAIVDAVSLQGEGRTRRKRACASSTVVH
jgi:hypothetical protein